MSVQCINPIMPGCILGESLAGDILFGCPSEIIKILSVKKIAMPKIFVMPSVFYAHGVVQAAIEFPLYNFLFMLGGLASGEKLTVIGTAEQNVRVRKVLRLTLLGPTEEQMLAWNISEYEIDLTLRLTNHFAVKNKDGEILKIDEMINFVDFDEDNFAKIGDVTIELRDTNLFKVSYNEVEYPVDINIYEQQKPPLKITSIDKAQRSIFGVTTLSELKTGFDASGYPSGYMLFLNLMVGSVDGVPWEKEHMKVNGINPDENKFSIPTHDHDDHANVYDVLVNGKRMTVILPKLQYHCLVAKVSLMLDMSEEEVMSMLDWVQCEAGQVVRWHGAKFEFWRTAHSIPTYGFRVTVQGKSIVFSGDTLWGTQLDSLARSGVIDKDGIDACFYRGIQDIPWKVAEICFMDCGGGMIHPDINEVAQLPEQIRKRIVPTHCHAFPEGMEDVFMIPSTVKAGQTWTLIKDVPMPNADALRIIHAPIFKGLSEEWHAVLLSQGPIEYFDSGKSIMKRGQKGEKFYLILDGTVEVVNENNETLAELSAGHFFGEMSLMYGDPVNATIRAKSRTRLYPISPEVFMEIINDAGLVENLKKIHKVRPALLKFGIFRDMSATVRNELSKLAEMVSFEAGDMIVHQGDEADMMYGVFEGKAKVIVRDNGSARQIATLRANEVFGEMGLLNGGVRNADVVAETDVLGFCISKKDFERLTKNVPSLRFAIAILAKERAVKH